MAVKRNVSGYAHVESQTIIKITIKISKEIKLKKKFLSLFQKQNKLTNKKKRDKWGKYIYDDKQLKVNNELEFKKKKKNGGWGILFLMAPVVNICIEIRVGKISNNYHI